MDPGPDQQKFDPEWLRQFCQTGQSIVNPNGWFIKAVFRNG